MYTYYTKEGKFLVKEYDEIPYNKLYRKVGPSLIYHDGSKAWYKKGKPHRKDGPAYIGNNGDKEWWVNGKWHRTDGPAFDGKYGDKEWYINGRLHRLDGPAVIRGEKNQWWVNGKRLNKKEVETWIKDNNINLKTKEHQALFMLKF